jgi:hypothetical protein
LPATNDHKELAAGEFYLASELHRRTSSIAKAAKERAVIAGVTFDTDTSELEGGDNGVLYDGVYVVVSVTVKSGSMRYSAKAIRRELDRLKLPQEDIDGVLENAGTMGRNSHTFTAMLKTDKTIRIKTSTRRGSSSRHDSKEVVEHKASA